MLLRWFVAVWILLFVTRADAAPWRAIALPAGAHGDESDVIALSASHDALVIAIAGPGGTTVHTTVDGGTTWFEVGGALPPRPWGPGGTLVPGALEALATRGGRVFMTANVTLGERRERRLYSSGLNANGWAPVKLGASTEVVGLSANDALVYAATASEVWSSPNGFDWTLIATLPDITRLVATDRGVIVTARDGAQLIAPDGVSRVEAPKLGAVVRRGLVLMPTDHGVARAPWPTASAWSPMDGLALPVRAVGVYYKWVAALVQPVGAAPYIALEPLD